MNQKLQNVVIAFVLLLLPHLNFGQAPTLGTTSSFALFTAAGAFNNNGTTQVTGDIGTNVGAFNGFPPGIVVGQIHMADPASAQAATDVDAAFSELSGRACGSVIATNLGNGQSLTPNIYCLGAASTITEDLILDGGGDPNALFIFKINGALSTSILSNVILTNSAAACNVFWQVNGAVALGEGSNFVGTIVANGAISLLEGASLQGRGLTREGAISLHNNTVSKDIGSCCVLPTASTISANGATTFCAGGSVVISGNVGGVFSTGATTASITVTTSGNYSVNNTNSCGTVTSNIITVTVSPNSQPNCTITGDDFLCQAGQSTQLCVPAGAASYRWSTGATTNCITVTAAGNYSVTVTNSSGCISTCSKTVTINAQPNCTITGDDFLCQAGQSMQLCVAVGAASYNWNTGGTSRCLTVNAAGNYSVTVTNSSGCISTCSKTVTINAQPNCTITGDDFLCQAGQSTQLCVPAGAASYRWSTGATTNCITVTAAGNYSVTVTNSSGCISTCSKTVTINAQPNCTITGDDFLCQAGQSTQLCVPAGAASYRWSTGATTNCITVTAAGNYSVTVTNSSGCISTCSKTVTINAQPNCTITGDDFICGQAQSTQLCVPAGAASYRWSTGATTNCITVTAAGNYSVTVTNSSGCISTCSKTVTINAQPNCTITGDDFICGQAQSTQLCVPAGAASYRWSTGATTNCITVTAVGNYSVTVTNSSGCISTCSKTVTINAQPNCTITGGDFICGQAQSTQLCVPAGAASYKWSTGATTNCITVTAVGNYSVTVTNSSGCISTCSKTVTQPLAPTCSITLNGNTAQAIATGGKPPYTYKWSNNATTSIITNLLTGIYKVTITDANGCISSCEIEMKNLLCVNLTSAGKIGFDQTICGPGADPAPIVEIFPPSPSSSNCPIEYMWMKSTIGGVFNNLRWQPVVGAYSKNYDPGPLFETTYFIRCTRRAGYPFIETNYIKITVGNQVVAKIEGPSVVCTDVLVTFKSTHPGIPSNFSWDFGPAATPRYANGASPKVSFSSFGLFEIKLSITQGNCTSTAVRRLDVYKVCPPNLNLRVNLTDDKQVQVNWSVQKEEENGPFVIEQSDDGKAFQAIGQLLAPKLTNVDQLEYEYIDVAPKSGWNYYRVMSVDAAGNQTYSAVKELIRYADSKSLRAYPNPVSQQLMVEIFDTLGDEVQMQVMDINGTILQTVTPPADTKLQAIDFSAFPAGIYFIKVRYGKNDVKVLKVVKN